MDSVSLYFVFTLGTISSCVLVWSYWYLDSEVLYRRFFALVNLFLFSMFLLVFSSDLLSLFVAWDLLGFSSFFLVIYYRSRASLACGLLTGLSNRCGDVFLLVLFGYGLLGSGQLQFSVFILLVLASMTKSAQLPFSCWLPAAMSAPTPVSALVHSSTLVTAGVFLLLRLLPSGSPLICGIGLLTTSVSGLAACLEADAKKIIALSTLSQLGIMFSCLGFGLRCLSFAHLNMHASFKSLLFIGMGCIIHGIYGSQESRCFPGLIFSSPLLGASMVVASLSLCGFVILSGSVSKEAILFTHLNAGSSQFFLILFYVNMAITLVYSYRLVTLLCGGRFSFPTLIPTVGLPWLVSGPVLVLTMLSILQGGMLSALFPLNSFVASAPDSVFGYFVLGMSFGFSVLLLKTYKPNFSPFFDLKASSQFFSGFSCVLSGLVVTEVSSISSGGISRFPSGVGTFPGKGTTLVKGLSFLIFLFLV